MALLPILLCSSLTRLVTCPVVVPLFLAIRRVTVCLRLVFNVVIRLVPLRLNTRLMLMCPCPILKVTTTFPRKLENSLEREKRERSRGVRKVQNFCMEESARSWLVWWLWIFSWEFE